jgi:hypothetical protein
LAFPKVFTAKIDFPLHYAFFGFITFAFGFDVFSLVSGGSRCFKVGKLTSFDAVNKSRQRKFCELQNFFSASMSTMSRRKEKKIYRQLKLQLSLEIFMLDVVVVQ